jgi:hypothetical protein
MVERRHPDKPPDVNGDTTDLGDLEPINPDDLVVGASPASFRLGQDARESDRRLAEGEESDPPG